MNTADVPPNQTLYVSNLYEKLKKEELKKCLYACFSQYGKILDVVVMKTFRLRGQAWVVFSDVSSATSALRAMQGFPMFDKPMRIQYARGKSDAIAKVEGNLRPRDKKASSAHNAAARDALIQRGKERRAGGTINTVVPQAPVGGFVAAQGTAAPIMATDSSAPNKILFVQNLPEATTSQMLSMLFQQFAGFKEVRMVEARPGIAFVEFLSEVQAGVAMNNLQDFKITPTNPMHITYAKQ